MHVMNRLLAAVWLAVSMVASAAAQDTSLAEAETEMEKTVVTATRTAVSLKDAPGAVTCHHGR